MTSASTARFPSVVMTKSCAILQFDQSIDRSLAGNPTPLWLNNGPVLQPLVIPAAMRDALHGMSGHLSSSTRMLPPYGFHFFHSGLIGGAVTDTSGSDSEASAATARTVIATNRIRPATHRPAIGIGAASAASEPPQERIRRQRLVDQFFRGLDAGDRQRLRVEQADLHQDRGLIPVDVLVIELVAAERDNRDE